MKTFILFWNPAISSYTLQRLADDIKFGGINSDFNWSIWEHQLAHEGDRFFMVRCKNKPVPGKLNQWGKQVWEPCIDEHTGICMAGTFTSEPYRDEDWAGKGRETYYIDMHIDVAVNPDKMPVLKTVDLMEAIPDFDWKGGHSGRHIEEDKAEKVAAMWEKFLNEHADELNNDSDDVFIDEKVEYQESVFHIFGIPNNIDIDKLCADAGKYCSDNGFSGSIKTSQDEPEENGKCEEYISRHAVLLGASTQGVELTYFNQEKSHLHISLPWLGSIGDVKLAFAIMQLLKEQYPECAIFYNDTYKDGEFSLAAENFDAMVVMRLQNMVTLINSSKKGTHMGAQGINSEFICPTLEDYPGKSVEDLAMEAMNTFISLQWNYNDIYRASKAKAKSPEGEEYILRFLINDEDTFVGVCQHVAMSGKGNQVKDILVQDFLKAMQDSPYLEMIDAMQFVLKKMPEDEWDKLYKTVNGKVLG